MFPLIILHLKLNYNLKLKMEIIYSKIFFLIMHDYPYK